MFVTTKEIRRARKTAQLGGHLDADLVQWFEGLAERMSLSKQKTLEKLLEAAKQADEQGRLLPDEVR